MYGPDLITRSISPIREFGPKKLSWQYNSRSDHHSQVSCWSIAFDLLLNSSLLRKHIEDGKVGFGLNHTMRDFQNNQEKDLDLVICRPNKAEKFKPQRSDVLHRDILTFADLGEHLELPLEPAELAALKSLPPFPIVPVGMVHVALEAKAAMTEFSKAKSRLYSELDSSISIINGHAQGAVAAALVMVNVAAEFRSTIINRNKSYDDPAVEETVHRGQPKPAEGIIDRVRQLRKRSDDRDRGFDAIGIVVIEMRNDGSPCKLITKSPPAVHTSDTLHYDQMIMRASSLYAQRFSSV